MLDTDLGLLMTAEGAFGDMFLDLARPWVGDSNLVAADLFSINDIDQTRPFVPIGIVLVGALGLLVPLLRPAPRLLFAVVGIVFAGLRLRARLWGAPSHPVVALTADRLVLLASRFRASQWRAVEVFGSYPVAEVTTKQDKDPFGLTLTLPSEHAARILRTLTGT